MTSPSQNHAPARSFVEHRERFAQSGFMLARIETLMLAIADKRLDRSCLNVLASIVEAVNRETLTTWISRERIAERCQISAKSVSTYLSQLRSLGYIASEYRPTPEANNRSLLHYTLTALSPEQLHAVLTRAVQSIRGERNAVCEFPSPKPKPTVPVPAGTAEADTSSQDWNRVPVLAGTLVDSSSPDWNPCPAPAGTQAPSSSPDWRSSSSPDWDSNSKIITTIETNNSSLAPTSASRAADNGQTGKGKAEKAKATRGTRLPEDWVLTQPMGQWVLDRFEVTPEQVRAEAARFKNHWLAKPGKDGRKVDWNRTWQNWCDSDFRRWPRRKGKPVGGDACPDLPLAPVQTDAARRKAEFQAEIEAVQRADEAERIARFGP